MNKEREREEAQGVSFTFSLQEKTVIGRKRKKKKGVMQEIGEKGFVVVGTEGIESEAVDVGRQIEEHARFLTNAVIHCCRCLSISLCCCC